MKNLRILLLFAVAFPLLGQQPTAKPTPFLEIHLVIDCASPQKMVIRTRQDHRQYCVDPAAIVTDRDVSSATSDHHLSLTFGAAGSERLYHATAAHIEDGGYLAILINGEAVAVALISEPVGDNVALTASGSKEELGSWAKALQSRSRPSVQVREVVPCFPGSRGARIEGTSEWFCLSPQGLPPLLDERDVSSAEVVKSDGRLGLSVHLKEASILKVRESTADLVGRKPLGFLVNNRLMMVSSIASPLGDSVTIYGDFSHDELQSLVNRINAEGH